MELTNNLGLDKLHGKKLSYNNYNDIYSALFILNSFKKNEGNSYHKTCQSHVVFR